MASSSGSQLRFTLDLEHGEWKRPRERDVTLDMVWLIVNCIGSSPRIAYLYWYNVQSSFLWCTKPLFEYQFIIYKQTGFYEWHFIYLVLNLWNGKWLFLWLFPSFARVTSVAIFKSRYGYGAYLDFFSTAYCVYLLLIFYVL